jgi:hypothetical protein
MDLCLSIDDAATITENVLNDWDLQTHGIDNKVLDDIKSAILNAYNLGCVHGVIDKDRFIKAIQYSHSS